MSQTLNIALVQSELFWESPEKNMAALDLYLHTVLPGTDLIVLPEMFTTGFTMEPSNIADTAQVDTLEWMKGHARSLNAAVMGSIIWKESGNYYNRLFFVYPKGNWVHYDKRHTFTLAGEDKVYRPGSKRVLIEYMGFTLCPMICYDLRFPVWSRNTEEFDALIYVANWPEPRINAWDALLRSRAIENMCYTIGVNRTGSDGNGLKYVGHSGVYDCLGDQLVYDTKPGTIYARLDREKLLETRRNLPFLEDRDRFNLED